MVVQVYRWSPRGSFGHFAVKLSDCTYLSFWPINNYNIKDASNLRSTASTWNDDSQTDRLIEGRGQDEVIEIRKPLNEQRMKEFWDKHKIKNFSIFHNCAIMTLNLIKAGDIDDDDPE